MLRFISQNKMNPWFVWYCFPMITAANPDARCFIWLVTSFRHLCSLENVSRECLGFDFPEP